VISRVVHKDIHLIITSFIGEQDLDVKKYKKRLRDLGEVVTDSEDEDDE